MGIGGRLEGLTQDLQQLQESERQLDHLIHICTTQLRLLSEDADSQRYPWACLEDSGGGEAWWAGPLSSGTREAVLGPEFGRTLVWDASPGSAFTH